jgi:hypothetical protein
MGKVMAIKWQSTENCKTVSSITSPAEHSAILTLITADFREKSLFILDYRNRDYVAYRDRRGMCPEFCGQI